MSKGVEQFDLAPPRRCFQPAYDFGKIIIGVVIDGEARVGSRHSSASTRLRSARHSREITASSGRKRTACTSRLRGGAGRHCALCLANINSDRGHNAAEPADGKARHSMGASFLVSGIRLFLASLALRWLAWRRASFYSQFRSVGLRSWPVHSTQGKLMDKTFDAERPATACDYEAPLSRDAADRIDVAFHKYGNSGTYYRVAYAGQTLVESTNEPLFEACRALVALGHAGRLEMWGGELYPRMIVRDIVRAARLTVIENVNAGPRVARYRPHPGTADGMRPSSGLLHSRRRNGRDLMVPSP
jgi:hypothetical protein